MTEDVKDLPATTTRQQQTVNPFARAESKHINAGAVAIESERAVAEAQGKLVIAKRFPRDPYEAFQRVIDSCRRPGLAQSAFYNYSRGGQNISGPSIRLAEELARCWGNIDYGLRELSNREGVSEMEAYAWDLETNTFSSQKFTVKHIRDTKSGSYDLTDQRDIYEITANLGARRLRARILAILPDDLVDAAVGECRKTIAGKSDEPMPERIKRMISKFTSIGVSAQMVETYLKHPLDQTVPDELVDMHGIYTSIKEGNSKIGDWFGAAAAANDNAKGAVADLNQQIKDKGGRRKAAPQAAAAAEPAAAQPPAPEQPPQAPAAAPAQDQQDGAGTSGTKRDAYF
jgi:hypothetical protein